MTQTTFHSIVIGGGSGGLSFARTAAGLGAQVLLVEQEDLGGTCVNRGCVPKKILWSAGRMQRALAAAHTTGILGPAAMDFQTLATRRDTHIAGIRDGFEESLAQDGVTLVRGRAQVDGTCVRVNDTTYTAENVVIATGARPTPLDIEGSEHLSDSRDVLSWTSRPARILIVGAGYIGCEFAAIFAAMGSDITLVQDGTTILDTFPPSLAQHVQNIFEHDGIALHMGSGLTAVHRTDTGLRCTLAGGAQVETDAVIAAVGRTPNTDTLGPLSDDLACADSGAAQVDDWLATNVAGVHALGDAADRMPLTPVATSDGRQLAHMLHGDGGALIDLDNVTTTAFVYPPAAFIGTADGSPRTDTFRTLSDSVLGPANGPEPQVFRLGFDTGGTLTGAEIAAEHAEDLIALLASLRRSGAKASDLDRIAPIHPSFVEEFTGG
ncbi:NAD(P)/FAD-dependent oxidoreductase [uncultured Tateyamaria sp.]|uniref:dihydrolipoyl dehydrogenase family protein n=1 Tax=uncultured Tateyamaria sp. TaxID=455651 RepID=UPI002636344B|nr:NAD(P)/FAD-dependent oxidoreductase [uncultured Tateyamaria sp.]